MEQRRAHTVGPNEKKLQKNTPHSSACSLAYPPRLSISRSSVQMYNGVVWLPHTVTRSINLQHIAKQLEQDSTSATARNNVGLANGSAVLSRQRRVGTQAPCLASAEGELPCHSTPQTDNQTYPSLPPLHSKHSHLCRNRLLPSSHILVACIIIVFLLRFQSHTHLHIWQ